MDLVPLACEIRVRSEVDLVPFILIDLRRCIRIWNEVGFRRCIRIWDEENLVPLACEDTHIERSELSTLGLRRCIRTWNEVNSVPLACEDAYAYETKWT